MIIFTPKKTTMSKNNQKVYQPDDNFFKKVMEEKENAKAYLVEFYPELANKLDVEQLVLQSESFLTPEFNLFKSDIIYRCPFKNSKEQLYLALIWENKLKPEKWVAIQIGLYIFLALNKMVKEKGRKVEPVLPLLFYNGKEKWIPKTIQQLFSSHEYFDTFKRFLPSFDFLFKNITAVPTEELLEIETAFFRSAMIAMANRHNFDLIITHFRVIFDVETKEQKRTVGTYVFGITDHSIKEIEEIFKNLDSTANTDKYMTTLEQLLKKGEEIGIKKGEEIGIKKGEEIGIKKGEEKGIKKGEEREKAFSSLIHLLKVIEKFPNWSVKEINHFTEIKTNLIKLLLTAIKTKNKKQIQKIIDTQFLSNIQLARTQKVKISKLITIILKNNKLPK